MGYFSPTYFSPLYFDTGGPSTGGMGGRRRLMPAATPAPIDREDDLFVVRIL